MRYLLSPIPFLFIFLHTLLRFFALTQISTLFFSCNCALFDKNTRVWGTTIRLRHHLMLDGLSSFQVTCRQVTCSRKTLRETIQPADSCSIAQFYARNSG